MLYRDTQCPTQLIASHAASRRNKVQAVFMSPYAAVCAVKDFVFIHNSALIALRGVLDNTLAVLVNS